MTLTDPPLSILYAFTVIALYCRSADGGGSGGGGGGRENVLYRLKIVHGNSPAVYV